MRPNHWQQPSSTSSTSSSRQQQKLQLQQELEMLSLSSTSTTRPMTNRKLPWLRIVLLLMGIIIIVSTTLVEGFERNNRDLYLSYRRWNDDLRGVFRRRRYHHDDDMDHHQGGAFLSSSRPRRKRNNHQQQQQHHSGTSTTTRSSTIEDNGTTTTTTTTDVATANPSRGTTGSRTTTFKYLRHKMMKKSYTVIEGVRSAAESSSLLFLLSSSILLLQNRNNQCVRRNTTTTTTSISTIFLRGGGGSSSSSSLLSPLTTLDRCGRFVAIGLGWIVTFQTLGAGVKFHGDTLFELATRWMSSETVQASHTVKRILSSVKDHGVIDVFSKYPTTELLASIYALSRLQAASQAFERRQYLVHDDDEDNDSSSNSNTPSSTTTSSSIPPSSSWCTDTQLLEDLAYFVPFASAAYGWTMDLATAGKLHFGDLEALIKKTSINIEDVVTVNMESKANRPAFFIVRDPRRNKLVLGIRGTWSAQDLLTDLCCTPEEYQVSKSTTTTATTHQTSTTRTHKAHHGMLEAARGVDILARDVIAKELQADPTLSLVIVGHSLGGSVAAVLGTLWEDTFPNLVVYAYGPACVTPSNEYNHVKDGGKTTATIVSAINEADPFPSLSLGHVADVSHALSCLCENPELRGTILIRTDGPVKDMDERDLEWCSETMQGLRESMVGDKLYPPGRLLYLTMRNSNGSSNNRSSRKNRRKKKNHHQRRGDDDDDEPRVRALEVPSDFFHDLVISPRMFDLTRHVPRLYHTQLRDCLPATTTSTDDR